MYQKLLNEWLDGPGQLKEGLHHSAETIVALHVFVDWLDLHAVEQADEAVGTVGDSSPPNIKFSDESAVAWFCECEYENLHFWALEQCPNCKKQRPRYTVIGAGS